MSKLNEAIKEIRELLKNSSEQLETLSKYAVHEEDKELMQALARSIKEPSCAGFILNEPLKGWNRPEDNYRLIEEKLVTIKNMRFEGKGGTKEESNFLSDVACSVVRFVFDAINLLISLATFGKTDKFFAKAPSVEEQKIITENKDALMATHAEIKLKLDALPEVNDPDNDSDDGLIHDR